MDPSGTTRPPAVKRRPARLTPEVAVGMRSLTECQGYWAAQLYGDRDSSQMDLSGTGPHLMTKLLGGLRPLHRALANGAERPAALHGVLYPFSGVPERGVALTAYTHYLDIHEARGGRGGVEFLGTVHSRQVNRYTRHAVEVPAFRHPDGSIELRRLVWRAASGQGSAWHRHAALVAAVVYRTSEVFVTEVGLLDGSCARTSTPVPGDPDAALQALNAEHKSLLALARTPELTPGAHCFGCPRRASCASLPRHDGVLGQRAPGRWALDITPVAAQTHRDCAGAWQTVTAMELPAARPDSEVIAAWVEHAHRRGIACSPRDLPPRYEDSGWSREVLSSAEYERVRVPLLSHLSDCIFWSEFTPAHPRIGTVWDGTADMTLRPGPFDAGFLEDTFVLRLTRCEADVGTGNWDEELAWWQYYLSAVALPAVDATVGELQIQGLGPDGATLRVWEVERHVAAVRRRFLTRVDRMTSDVTFPVTPGAHCVRCPVQSQCPSSTTTRQLAVPKQLFEKLMRAPAAMALRPDGSPRLGRLAEEDLLVGR